MNCDATVKLAKAALNSGVNHFIFVSTVKVFGENNVDAAPFRVGDRLNPEEPYAESKAAAELALTELCADTAIRLSLVRSPLVYGPGAKANVQKLVKLAQTSLPLPFRHQAGRRSLISVQNLADLLGQVADIGGTSAIQIILAHESPSVSTGEIVALIRTNAGRRTRLFRIPTGLLTGLKRWKWLNGIIERLFGSLVVEQDLRSIMGWTPTIDTETAWRTVTCANREAGKLLFLVTEDWYFISHRKSLALAAQRDGWEVHVACIVNELGDEIRNMGFKLHPLRWQRIGTSLMSEISAVRQIAEIYRDVRPEIVHHVALKPIIFGGLAARMTGVKNVISAFAGLGSTYDERGVSWKTKLKRHLLNLSFRMVIRGDNQWVIAQNSDDFSYLSSLLEVNPAQLRLIPGSGLDLHKFEFIERTEEVVVSVAMASRMIYAKGVEDFVQVSQELQTNSSGISFVLAGGPDFGSSDAIPMDQLQEWSALEGLEWLGHVPNMEKFWHNADIAVLPSRYREGIPRSLLEAAASGCAMVAYDVPGCRDLIEHNVTGLLADPDKANSLADSISFLVANPIVRRQLGQAARDLVVQKFSDDKILHTFLEVYDQCDQNNEKVPCPVPEKWMCCHSGRPIRVSSGNENSSFSPS